MVAIIIWLVFGLIGFGFWWLCCYILDDDFFPLPGRRCPSIGMVLFGIAGGFITLITGAALFVFTLLFVVFEWCMESDFLSTPICDLFKRK